MTLFKKAVAFCNFNIIIRLPALHFVRRRDKLGW